MNEQSSLAGREFFASLERTWKRFSSLLFFLKSRSHSYAYYELIHHQSLVVFTQMNVPLISIHQRAADSWLQSNFAKLLNDIQSTRLVTGLLNRAHRVFVRRMSSPYQWASQLCNFKSTHAITVKLSIQTAIGYEHQSIHERLGNKKMLSK